MRASFAVLLLLAPTACSRAELGPEPRAATAPPLPLPAVEQEVVSAPPPPPAPPWAIPRGFTALVDRPPVVVARGQRLVVMRWLRRCERFSGPSGTITLPKSGSGSFTMPGSSYSVCDSFLEGRDGNGAALWPAPVDVDGASVSVLDDRLLVASARAFAVRSVATGDVLASVRDPVLERTACVDRARERVFIGDPDEDARKFATVDLATMRVTPAGTERCPTPMRRWCEAGSVRGCRESRDEQRGPTTPVADFYEEATIRTGTAIEVLLGRRTKGRQLPMIVAIDPKTHAKRWASVVPPASAEAAAAESALFPHRFADVAEGRVFVEYDAWADHPHLAAFDLKDGTRLWDVAIASFNAFTPTAERIYLTDATRGIVVLDAHTGVEQPS